MGGQQTKSLQETGVSFDRQDSNVSTDFPDYLIEDLLIYILSFLPANDLIQNCRLVCKQWKDLVDRHSVWKIKCERECSKVPVCKLDSLPANFYRYIYLHSKSEKNLVKNPCGDNDYNGWVLFEAGGDGFSIQEPPAGSDPVPEEVGSQTCFATSYEKCTKYQLIDLYEKKISEFLLNYNLVNIRIGEWYAARFDCASEYDLNVSLLDKDKKEIDKFEFHFSEEQWNGKKWYLVTHEFKDVSNARFVHFEHSGNDLQFWAGHYGIKMTGSFVELCIK